MPQWTRRRGDVTGHPIGRRRTWPGMAWIPQRDGGGNSGSMIGKALVRS
jgi:hypothetical protein